MTDTNAGAGGIATPWRPITADANLTRPITSLGPGNVPSGGNLRLDIGWEAFEQLTVEIARHVVGLNKLRFRRYGTAGQAQHGIDVVGRRADGSHTVVQCKHVTSFTKTLLRTAVNDFAKGRQPFDASQLIIATNNDNARKTQVQDELAALQTKYRHKFDLELWGPEEINGVLRVRGDIVARFWTRETAATFSTGAPLPGVAAPAPEWTRVADLIMFGPLEVDGLDEAVAAADRLQTTDPLAAASAYGQIGDNLAADGFSGHAHLVWQRQLSSLDHAADRSASAELAARLAALALHEGDMHHARLLHHRLRKLAEHPEEKALPTGVTRHHKLLDAALHTALHPFGNNDRLVQALIEAIDDGAPEYLPVLVTVLAELAAADAIPRGGTAEPAAQIHAATIQTLVRAALERVEPLAPPALREDVRLRLRLAAAVGDPHERTRLLTDSRLLRLRRTHAAAVLGAEARRNALEGSVEDALGHWRQAVSNALHEGLTEDASDWLYAIRALNVRYGPWTDSIDEEHRLAQALPSAAVTILRRARNPENDARRHALANDNKEAVRAARRWLADSIAVGSWIAEDAAVELLGNLFAESSEPGRAALCYQWSGRSKSLLRLVDAVGDLPLPIDTDPTRPWWSRVATMSLIAAQEDLLPDDVAAAQLAVATELAMRGRAGELLEGPHWSLTTQATKTACALAARGSVDSAKAVLDLLAVDVAREPNQHRPHDAEHVDACLAIAAEHRALAYTALTRFFDLAAAGADNAVGSLPSRFVRAVLGGTDRHWGALLPEDHREELRARLRQLAADGHYEAITAVALLGIGDPQVLDLAATARDRLLARPKPDGHTFPFGPRLGSDGYFIARLGDADRQACIEKLLAIAEDRRETASTRQDALDATYNIIAREDDSAVKSAVHRRSRWFVDGAQDGSALDAETTRPHPLSTFSINFGSASLRPNGLGLALVSATTAEDRAWVRDRAIVLLRSGDAVAVHRAASVLSELPDDDRGNLEPGLLAAHQSQHVRQLAATDPDANASVLRELAADPIGSVRLVLAEALSTRAEGRASAGSAVVDDVLATLAHDIRHSVRNAATITQT